MIFETENFLDFNIQLFAEEADNTEEVEDTELDEDEVELTDSDTDDAVSEEEQDEEDNETSEKDVEIDRTKAFSERLKQKTQDIEKKYNDKLEAIAKNKGYDTWEDFEKAQNRDALVEAGVEDPDKFSEVLNRMIKESPEVVKAREIIEQQQQAENDKIMAEELKLIHAVDDSINTLDDISKMDNCNDVIEKLNKGYSLYDAYVLCNMNRISQINKDKKDKDKANNTNSKAHMKNATGGSKSYVEIPSDVYKTYKKNLPNWTDKQIREHYAKNMD